MSDEQGEAPPPPRPGQLDRAPGERYRPRPGQPGAPAATPPPAGLSAAIRAASPFLVAIAGALLIAVLGSIDIGVGLLAVSAFIGWAVGIAIIWGGVPAGGRRRMGAWSAGLAAASIVLGLALLWAWSRAEGGAMDPIAYLDARFGPSAWLNVVAAAAVAWLRAH
jgi:hypothetical protein